jgi:hypothetical protein
VYSCNGLPSAAVSTLLAQLLTSSASRSPQQSQGRGAGRGGAKSGNVSGGSNGGAEEYDGPISRECCWAWPELPHGGLLGGLLTPPHLHRNRPPPAHRPVLAGRTQGSTSTQSASAPRNDAVPVLQPQQARPVSDNFRDESSETGAVQATQTTVSGTKKTNRTIAQVVRPESSKGPGQEQSSPAPPFSSEAVSSSTADWPNPTESEMGQNLSTRPRMVEDTTESKPSKPKPVKPSAGRCRSMSYHFPYSKPASFSISGAPFCRYRGGGSTGQRRVGFRHNNRHQVKVNEDVLDFSGPSTVCFSWSRECNL